MSSSARRAATWIALAALGWAGQQPGAPELRGAEGPLENGSFLPFDERASDELAAADRQLAELLPREFDATDERAWIEVLDHWHTALRDSPVGAMVAPRPRERGAISRSPWPDIDGTSDETLDRRRDGVEAGVLRRLAGIPPAARALWRSRFEPLADERLARSSLDVAQLAELERAFPATRAALRAALALADVELERGRPDAASNWLRRGRAHLARLDDSGAPFAAALERRDELVRAETRAFVRDDGADAWRSAQGITALGEILVDEGALRFPRGAFEPGLGVRGGLCFLDDARAVVHVPPSRLADGEVRERFLLIDLAHATRLAVATPAKLLDALAAAPTWSDRPVEPPGWALAPASDGQAIVSTLGRRTSSSGNALLCTRFEIVPGSAEPASLELSWAWFDGRRIAGPAPASGALELEGGALEFQPGAIVRGGDVYVAVREFAAPPTESDEMVLGDGGAEIRTSLVALDLATGALRWRTQLGKGVEVQRTRGRFLRFELPPASAQPLAWISGQIFVGSHTGFGALLDAADGRVAWAFKNRRRDGERRTWTGARAPVDAAGAAIVWAPADSDHVYWLRGGPDLDGRGIALRAPRPIGEAEILIGGDADEALVLTRVGAQRTLASWNALTGRSYCAATLGPSETFSGEGLASAERAWFASTRGLYLFDRTRELFLSDYASLRPLRWAPASQSYPGGAVLAREHWVCVLGPTTLWLFATRP